MMNLNLANQGAAGISGALIFGYLSSLICKPKMKD